MDEDLKRLEKDIERIWDVARRLGLDPYPTRFEIVPSHIMYEFGAYGLPGRFSHWTHGKAYHQLKTRYDYGLSKIYELVINADPCYGFLLDTNSPIQNKLVVAHVFAHSDFFKNNAYFAHTPKQMIESASISAERIRRYEFEHGSQEVERFLDAVLAVQEHVNPNPYIRRRQEADRKEASAKPRPSGPYSDLFEDEPAPAGSVTAKRKVPPEPEKDLLLFILENAPSLEDWQKDVVSIVRSEMIYFIPQMKTKIMNEGWATYWHARIMRELELGDDEYTEYARMHAAVLTTTRMHINPYLVGLKIFEHIEKSWDEPTEEERQRSGRKGGEGKAKIFEVRETESDASFIRNHLTEELVEELDLYIYKLDGEEWKIVEKNWEKVRDSLVASLVNLGHPYIVVEDGDYKGNRELYLKHCHEGLDLDIDYAEKALRHVFTLWSRPVHIETMVDGRKVVLSYDGRSNTRAIN